MKRCLLVLLLAFSVTTRAQDYFPDPTFGINGVKKNGTGDSYPLKVFFEDNKYILLFEDHLTSYNVDGTLNPAFGNNGKVLLPAVTGTTYNIRNCKFKNGFLYLYGHISLGSSANIFIAKLTLSGSLDGSFGSNGICVHDFGGSDNLNDIIIKDDGSIFSIGKGGPTGNSVTVVSKINPDGTLNTSFDPLGYKSYPTFTVGLQKSGIHEYDGGLLLVGIQTQYNALCRIFLMKINENGTIVNSFGTAGLKTIPLSAGMLGYYFLESSISADNKLYLCYHYTDPDYDYNYLKKYDLNLDQTIFTVSLPLAYPCFKVLDNNKTITTGTSPCYTGGGCSRQFRMRRYNPDGSPDVTFNQTGLYTYDFSPDNTPSLSDDESTACYQHTDGRILIAGTSFGVAASEGSWGGFAMVRLTDNLLGTDDIGSGDNDFYLYPNPSKDEINIQSKAGNAIESIIVADLSGKMIVGEKGNISTVNISALQSGMYILNVVSGGKQHHLKFVKQ